MDGNPNPGSGAAKRLGCTCDTLANNHGVYPPIPGSTATGSRPMWIVDVGCQVHPHWHPAAPREHLENCKRGLGTGLDPDCPRCQMLAMTQRVARAQFARNSGRQQRT